MADLPVMASNWMSGITPVLMAICSVRRADRCSSIMPEIESSDIGSQDRGIIRSQFGLGITTQIACFQFFEK